MTAQPKPTIDDPAALLTLVQAAEWAGVPLASVQSAMAGGALRSEVVRQKDREVQRIRLVDLQDWVAALAPAPDPAAEQAPEAEIPSPEPPSADAQGPNSDPEPTPESIASHGAAPLVPLRAPEEWEGALGWLRDQQEELREQCMALRQRLVHSEAERQRALEALLQWQDRWGASLPALQGLARPWWRRPGLWIACGLLLVAWWSLRARVTGVGERLAEQQTVWAADWSAASQEQWAFQSRRMQAETSAWKQSWQAWVQEQAQRQAEEQEKDLAQAGQTEAWRSQWDDRWSSWRAQQEAQDQSRQQSAQREHLRRAAWEEQQAERQAQRESALLELVRGELREQGQASDRWRQELEHAWKAREAQALAENQRLLEGWQASEAAAKRQQQELGSRIADLRAQQAHRERQDRERVLSRGRQHAWGWWNLAWRLAGRK